MDLGWLPAVQFSYGIGSPWSWIGTLMWDWNGAARWLMGHWAGVGVRRSFLAMIWPQLRAEGPIAATDRPQDACGSRRCAGYCTRGASLPKPNVGRRMK